MTAVTFANPDALFTSKHVADHRHMTENALAQERWRGEGPRYRKLGNRVYYLASDLKAWLDAHVVETNHAGAQRE